MLHQSDLPGRARIAVLGRDGQVVERVGTIARPSGAQLTFNDVTAHDIAFVFTLTNGDQASSLWDLYLFDRAHRTLRRVARNPRDSTGKPLQGSFVHPVLTGRYLYWIQAARTGLPWGGSEIEQYDLTTARTRTVYRGLAVAMTPLGGDLVFTGVPAGASRKAPTPPVRTLAIDQASARSVTPPSGLTAAQDNADTMRSDGGLVVWDTSRGGLRAWSGAWGRSVTLVPGLGDWSLGNRLQFTGVSYPGIAGHVVTFYSGRPYALDLRTNSFTALAARAGGIDSAGPMVEIEQYATAAKALAPPFRLDQTVVDLASLPDLGGCGR